MPLQVFHQHARVVEAHRLVVEQPAREFDRVMQLHPGRLVRRPREGGGVRAAEAVDRKTLHRREQLVRDLAGHVVGQAPGHELVLERGHLDPVQMPRHRAAKTVGTTRRHAGDIHRDLDDLLLVQDHAKGVAQDRFEEWMGVGDRLASLLASDVRMDRVALDRPRTDDRDFDDEVVERLGPRAWQCLHLRPRLDLEHADGVRLAAHLVDGWIRERQRVEVGT